MTIKQIATAALLGAAVLSLGACHSKSDASTASQSGGEHSCNGKSSCTAKHECK